MDHSKSVVTNSVYFQGSVVAVVTVVDVTVSWAVGRAPRRTTGPAKFSPSSEPSSRNWDLLRKSGTDVIRWLNDLCWLGISIVQHKGIIESIAGMKHWSDGFCWLSMGIVHYNGMIESIADMKRWSDGLCWLSMGIVVSIVQTDYKSQ